MKRLLNALIAFLDAWNGVPAAAPSTETEARPDPYLTTEEWQQAVKHATANAFRLGHAQGELDGRAAQILELQQEFGVDDNRNVFEYEDALRYGSRLRH